MLKLIALDEEDLRIVSAHAQDAVLRIGDIDWRAAERRVVLPMNRFAWEKKTGLLRGGPERRNAVLRFERVDAVRSAGIPRDRPDAVLSLLAIRFTPADPPSGAIELVFSGEGALRLEAECIEAELADLGGAWEALARPRHPD
ncbi:MAG: DUF2948 family protein [Rhizobiaceae bacterium]|nr:DUF2948 family protein [Rhizobiaceae bacterium]MCV0405958.1 DUF2948 family protein [Rhizobiaceae bacterium]